MANIFHQYLNLNYLNADILLLQEAQMSSTLYEYINSSAKDFTIVGSPLAKSKILLKQKGEKYQRQSNNFQFITNLLPACFQQQVSDATITINKNIAASAAMGTTHIHIINVYAPVSPIPKTNFYQAFSKLLCSKKVADFLKNKFLILGGDFNNIMQRSDTTNPSKFNDHMADQTYLHTLLTQYNLIDVCDLLNITAPAPTNDNMPNRPGLIVAKRRLDRFYTNISMSEVIQNYKLVTPSYYSTHKTIEIQLKFAQETPETGHPRFIADPSIYQDQTLKKLIPTDNSLMFLMKSTPDESYQNIYDKYIINICDHLKALDKAIRIPIKQNKIKEEHILDKPETFKSWIPYKNYPILNQTYHLQRQDAHIAKMLINDKITTQTADFLKEAHSFYSDLFGIPSDQFMDPQEIDSFIAADKKVLSPQEATELIGKVTEAELDQVFKKIRKKRSAPGPDGITYTFILSFKNDMKKPLMDITNAIMETGVLPETLKGTLIKLIPKKKDSILIEDFRPITLTNVCLRIASAIINNRILKFINKLIHPNQTGFIPNRRMDDNILQLQTILENSSNPDGGVVQIDFQKAFDRISHAFLIKVLEHKNFPPNIINFVKSLEQQQGQILINHLPSATFQFHSGLRQGNPISPTLFVLAIEPYLQHIRNHTNGITLYNPLGNVKEKVIGFADDVSILFSNKQDVCTTFTINEVFSKLSNMRINRNKTKIIFFSEPLPATFREFNLHFPDYTITSFAAEPSLVYLGIPPKGVDWSELIKEIIKQINQAIILHTPISIQTEAISIYCLSRVYFRDIFTPIKQKDVQVLHKVINNKLHNVSIKTLLIPKQFGGFSLMDLTFQLLGKRAKIIFFVYQQTSLWLYRYFRLRLQQFIQDFLLYHKYLLMPYVRENQIIRKPRGPFLRPNRLDSLVRTKYNTLPDPNPLGTFTIAIPWWYLLDGSLADWVNKNPLLKQQLQLSVGSDSSSWEIIQAFGKISRGPTRINIEKYFKPNEISWIEAWFSVTNRTDNPSNFTIYEYTTAEIYKKLIKDKKKGIKSLKNNMVDIKGQPLTLESFKHFNKKRHEDLKNPITRPNLSPRFIPTSHNTKENWAKFWKQITKIQAQQPGILEHLHRFNLGHYEHKFNTHRTNPKLPYSDKMDCCFCEGQSETYQHIFQDCEMSQQVWTLMGNPTKPSLAQLYLNLGLSPEEYIHFNNYIEFIWHLRQKRRYTTSNNRTKLNSEDLQQSTAYFMKQKNKPGDYYRY